MLLARFPGATRTDDFVVELIRDAQTIDEYAFALGALGHYAADNRGHPLGVNRAVPLMYPKLKAKATSGSRCPKDSLQRAFRTTYGLDMKDLFLSEDLAIATYRHAVATTIPEMTKVAWGRKRAGSRSQLALLTKH